VYRSSTSGLMKVAFSVPIWNRPADEPTPTAPTDPGDDPAAAANDPADADPAGEAEPAGAAPGASAASAPREVIGVLAMSVNVHEFKVLEEDLAGGSEVVLIDLRTDWIEGQGRKGLILHHPQLKKGQLARMDQERLDQITEANPILAANFDGAEHFWDGEGYSDPLAADAKVKYWGAFEPVRFDLGGPTVGGTPRDRFGWVVLVQKPMLE
jgi:hypothetical protein